MLNTISRELTAKGIEMTTEGTEPNSFGAILKTLREGAGLSQRALSDATGISQFVIRNLEKGEVQNPGLHEVMTLGTYFGLRPTDVAILFGLWSERKEYLQHSPRLDSLLDTINTVMLNADIKTQYEFIDSLELVVALLNRRHPEFLAKEQKPEITAEAINKLPKFLQERYR